MHGEPPAVHVVLSPDRGERSAILPTGWQQSGSATARRILVRAQAVMRGLRSVRQLERVNTVPSLYALTDGRAQWPDRWTYTTYVVRPPARPQREDELVTIGARQWSRFPGGRWQLEPPDGTLPFRTPTLFTWSSYAEAVRLIDVRRLHGATIATLALMDPGAPAWWTLHVELATGHVLDTRLVTAGNFVNTEYSQFDSAAPVHAPTGPGT